MSNIKGFDWRYLESCQYEIDTDENCGEPAIAKVWWDDDNDKEKSMYLCEKHFDFMLKVEGANQ